MPWGVGLGAPQARCLAESGTARRGPWLHRSRLLIALRPRLEEGPAFLYGFSRFSVETTKEEDRFSRDGDVPPTTKCPDRSICRRGVHTPRREASIPYGSPIGRES